MNNMMFLKNLCFRESKESFDLFFSSSKKIHSKEIEKKYFECKKGTYQQYLKLDDLFRSLVFQHNFKTIDAAQMIQDYCELDYLFKLYNIEHQEKLIQDYAENYSILPNMRHHKFPSYEILVSLNKFESNQELKINTIDMDFENRQKIFNLNLKSFLQKKKKIVKLNEENFFEEACDFFEKLSPDEIYFDIEFQVIELFTHI
jgi:hypothetical protein